MATATEMKQGAQAATDQTVRATGKALDSMSEYYLAVFDAGLKVQARAIETAKTMLDESAAIQRSNRKIAEELLQSASQARQELFEVAQSNLRSTQSNWVDGR